MRASEVEALLPYLSEAERAELLTLVAKDRAVWRPQPGPQSEAYYSDADIVGFGGSAGGGKGIGVHEEIPTPDGWKTMGEVAVGDVLFDKDGNGCRVVAVTDIQHRDCFQVKFDDGSVIIADDVHRWLTLTDVERTKGQRCTEGFRARRRATRASRAKENPLNAGSQASVTAMNRDRVYEYLAPPSAVVRDTLEIRRTLHSRAGRVNHSVEVAGALNTPAAELPVDPYTLGLWLGDGKTQSATIGMLVDDWAEILPHVPYGVSSERPGRQKRPFMDYRFQGLQTAIRGLGLLDNKHIPAAYLRAAVEQRRELLRGLLDTDGTCDSRGQIEIGLSHERLATDVHELILSLGIKCTRRLKALSQRNPKWRDHYRMKFVAPFPAFKLRRKLARQKLVDHRPTTRLRYIVDVQPVDTVPTRCIAVDSPSRTYLVGRSMIPTHNTDLMCGLVLTHHRRSVIFRREKAQTERLTQRLTEILGNTDGLNGQKGIWQLGGGRLVEFGGLDNPGDERRWQGRDHDLKAYDEVTEMREAQVRYTMGWNRSGDPKQRSRVVMTFNPPTTAEGRWVIAFFAPWLDPMHPNPAKPGELRWFTTIAGKDVEVPDSRPFVLVEEERVYDFDPKRYRPEKIIRPKSRTFIPSRVTDNPYYMATGYIDTLQALPEPLRSQMLEGDFMAGVEDDEWQVIPTAWVDAAQARWKPRDAKGAMDSLGVDVSRGGRDATVIARRHGAWFDEPIRHPGTATPDGPTAAGYAITARRDRAPVHIDIVGWGSSAHDFLVTNEVHTVAVNGAEGTEERTADKEATMAFANVRALLWWRMREALDPLNPDPIALPPDPKLKADLCAPRWRLTARGILVEAKEEIIKRLGRSPDDGDAYVMANMNTPKRDAYGSGALVIPSFGAA